MAGDVKSTESDISKLSRELASDRPLVGTIRPLIREIEGFQSVGVRLNRREAGVLRRARNFLSRRGGRRR